MYIINDKFSKRYKICIGIGIPITILILCVFSLLNIEESFEGIIISFIYVILSGFIMLYITKPYKITTEIIFYNGTICFRHLFFPDKIIEISEIKNIVNDNKYKLIFDLGRTKENIFYLDRSTGEQIVEQIKIRKRKASPP